MGAAGVLSLGRGPLEAPSAYGSPNGATAGILNAAQNPAPAEAAAPVDPAEMMQRCARMMDSMDGMMHAPASQNPTGESP